MFRLSSSISALLALAFLHCFIVHTESWRIPTIPKPITGRPSCLQPARYLVCTRETRSNFVAGVGTSYGIGHGVHTVCSDGGISTFLGAGQFQQTWDMSAPTSPTFPKLPDGTPDLRYFSPYNSSITQMIVLEATNPFGPKFGSIPAIIFGFLTDDGLDFAICGNADYAMFYLYPGRFRPPPTQVTLRVVYTNPLSEERTPRFLGNFDGKCGLLGRGYLGGDPYGMSKFHLKYTTKACFAAYAPFFKTPTIVTDPPRRVWSDFNASDYKYRPCGYNKAAAKGGSAPLSCVMQGTAIATGKYGAINFDEHGEAVDWEPGSKTGQLSEVAAKDVFLGTQPQTAEAAPLPDAEP